MINNTKPSPTYNELTNKYFSLEDRFIIFVKNFSTNANNKIQQENLYKFVRVKPGELIDETVVYRDIGDCKNVPFIRKPLLFSDLFTLTTKNGLYLDQINANTFNSKELLMANKNRYGVDIKTIADRATVLLYLVEDLHHIYLNTLLSEWSIEEGHEELLQINREVIALRREIVAFIKANTTSFWKRIFLS